MTSASTYSESERDEVMAQIGDTAVEPPHLPKRPLPHLDAHYLLHGSASPPNETLIVMSPQALLQVHEHGISNMRTELGGFLLGHAYEDGDKLHIKVEVALPAVSDDHGPVHFTFNANSWSHCHAQKEAHYPSLQIVGWYHTHPGLGVFYSSDDVVVHSAGFALPWHVGLVVDPVRNTASFFGWVNGELANLSGFYELSETASSQSAIRWRYVNTNVWDFNNYELPMMAQGEASRQALATTAVSPTEWALVAGSLAALIFFFLAGWLTVLNRQVSQLEQVVLTQAGTDSALVAQACPDPRLRILTPLTATAYAQGATIPLVGTADLPEATRYQVERRLAESDGGWSLIGTTRFNQSLGTLVRWKTRDVAPGVYDVRLTAVDRTNLQLANAPLCQIQVMITQ